MSPFFFTLPVIRGCKLVRIDSLQWTETTLESSTPAEVYQPALGEPVAI
jgi:hypothetical protein